MEKVADSQRFAKDHATIEQAYKELSQEAFATWMRFQVATDSQLTAGRKHVTKMMGLSDGRAYVILKELENKGYIEIYREHIGVPSEIRVLKRALISGPNRIVKLTHHLFPGSNEGLYALDEVDCGEARYSRAEDIPVSSESVFKSILNVGVVYGRDLYENPIFFNTDVIQHVIKTKIQVHPEVGETATNPVREAQQDMMREAHQDQESALPTDGSLTVGKKAVHKKLKKRPVSAPSCTTRKTEVASSNRSKIPRSYSRSLDPIGDKSIESPSPSRERRAIDATPKPKKTGVDMSAMRRAASQQAATRKATSAQRVVEAAASRKNIDWTELDQRGRPQVTFQPSDDQRVEMLKTLKLAPQSPKRRELVDKLGDEYARIYTRYRRMDQRENGRVVSYEFSSKEKKHAIAAAILCLQYAVTPRQVLEYWHAQIKHFADAKLRVPPITFLTSPTNVDRVACQVTEVQAEKGRQWRIGDFINPDRGHGFGDTSRLHPGLRPGLEGAGFDLSEVSDRDLMTVQGAALDLVMGNLLSLGGVYGKMAVWAAEHVYHEIER